MFLCQNSYRVCSYFVGCIAVFSNPVSSCHHHRNHSFLHQEACRIISYQSDRDIFSVKFPARQSCSLKERPGLSSINLNLLFLLEGRPDYSQGCAVAGCSQRPSITMSQDRLTIFDQVLAPNTYFLVGFYVFSLDVRRFLDHSLLKLG